jgi:hypothetical protein
MAADIVRIVYGVRRCRLLALRPALFLHWRGRFQIAKSLQYCCWTWTKASISNISTGKKKKKFQSGEQAGGVNFARHVTILNRNPKSTRIWRTGGIIKMLLPVSLDWIALTVYCNKRGQRPESNVCWQCLLLLWKIRSSMEKLTVSLRGGAVVAPLGR